MRCKITGMAVLLYVMGTVCAVHAQRPYFPGAVWQTKKPAELRLNGVAVNSAVQFARRNEIKLGCDLRIANMISYKRAGNAGYLP